MAPSATSGIQIRPQLQARNISSCPKPFFFSTYHNNLFACVHSVQKWFMQKYGPSAWTIPEQMFTGVVVETRTSIPENVLTLLLLGFLDPCTTGGGHIVPAPYNSC